MNKTELVAEGRDVIGKKVKALRREGMVPAHIVSKGKESVVLQAEYNQLYKVLQTVGYTQPVSLKVGDQTYTVLVTDVKLAPAKNTVEHVTFQEVKRGEKVQANVPVELVGDAPANSKGLVVLQLHYEVPVSAGALSIPEKFEVDISVLSEVGDTITVADIQAPEAVELHMEADELLVKVDPPRVEEEPEEAEPAEGEGESADAESTEASEEKPADEA